jgi:hypothetical protein
VAIVDVAHVPEWLFPCAVLPDPLSPAGADVGAGCDVMVVNNLPRPVPVAIAGAPGSINTNPMLHARIADDRSARLPPVLLCESLMSRFLA